ncbi:BNR/Asp-box repeat protein [Bernardetia litoralis DSM 6794]|uniref:BNR/Asp-box repeat protein n=2 Tax=Bernardetia litoralis TaxID=999 RepID=I4AQQ1_BERLS|nr:BNR/Asp-box repeat protein [Bernardetia litoralis DSM 6794]
MNKKYLLVGATALGLSAGIFGYSQLDTNCSVDLSENQDREISAEEWSKHLAEQKAAKHNKKGYFKTMEASGYFKYMNDIRTKAGEKHPSYKAGHAQLELEKALSNTRTARTEAFTFDERGPGNVAGRTRSILVDVRDTSNNTWFVGTAGGGIWKTTDGGTTWEDKSGGMSHLGISSLAQCESSPTTMYATTGETPFSGNGINGGGVFKSTDGGDSWSRLDSTIPRTTDFLHATRVIVSPTDPNLVLVTSSHNPYLSSGIDPDDKRESYILRSTDGGDNWTITYSNPVLLQQIIAEPGNFNNMYATGSVFGSPQMVRSTDAGLTWQTTKMTSIAAVESSGNTVGRSELAISPTNPAVIYASVDMAGISRLLVSSDRGISWKIIEENGRQKNNDYLGGQGGYDNAITVSSTDENTVYWGGVDLWKTTIDPASTRTGPRQFLGADLENMDFLTFTNVEGFTLLGGQLEVNTPAEAVTVEIRFGSGKSQKAHRFVAGGGGVGAGIAANQYIYQDYVDVPFEVWDTENNQQLMFSFRDQNADGEFTWTERDDDNDPDLLNTREYMFVHSVPYDDATPSSLIAKPAGHEVKQIYFVWPYLTEGETFDPNATSTIRFNYGGATYQNSTITRVSDAYGNAGNNLNELHPDHHMLTYAGSRLISVNDGGIAYSDDNGTAWTEVDNLSTNDIVTSQYYKVDRHPTENRYVGGMQDNGSWVSPIDPTFSSDHTEASGGDGMEAVWHATNPDLVLTTSQYNTVYRSTNGGTSFARSNNGITDTSDDGTAPFVTRLGYSVLEPETVFAVGNNGVYKSTDFGQRWNRKSITNDLWLFSSSTTSVYPSLADPNIVWAGGGMAEDRTMFLSQDGGETFTALPNPIDIGVMSGFATDPENPNTAYMLFGQGGVGKVWRTTDLGQTWREISGFGLGTTSRTGFPDVVPFSMVVWGDTLFVGTEIGLFASYDDGAAWEIVPEFPAVAVQSLVVKEEDGQLVIGTFGRGVWSSDMGITYNRDDETPTDGSLTVSAISGSTKEDGTTATFTVALPTAPTADVTVTVASGDATEGTVAPATLTFTSANFATAQTVTVTGVADAEDDGDITYNVNLTTASADAAYDDKTGSVSVTNVDVPLVSGIFSPTDAINLKVYPNPTQDVVRFELPKVTGNYEVRVYTITGKEVLSTSNHGGGNMELNIQKFVGGTYILKATSGDKVYVQKVVLQK